MTRKPKTRPDTTIAAGQDVDSILITTKQGIISRSQVDYYIQSYMELLPVPEQIYKNSNVFNGMLLYLYNKCIIKVLPNDYMNDYTVLDQIFMNIYIPLCTIYGYNPSVLSFTGFMRLNENTINCIHNNRYQDGITVNNSKDCKRIIDHWFTITKGILADSAANTNGNPAGKIFILKAVHGLQDQNTVRIETSAPGQDRLTNDELDAIAQQDEPPTPGMIPDDII